MESTFHPSEATFTGRLARPARPGTVIIFVLAGLTLVLSRPRLPLYLAVSFFCVCFLLAAGMGILHLLRRLSAPLAISGALLVLQAFSRGDEAIFNLRVWGITISLYREGLHTGVLLACRVICACLLLAFLGFLVPVQEFLVFLRTMKVPEIFIIISLMVYRFSGLILEEAARIREAQRLRLGYAGFTRGVRSVSLLGACLFLRVNDRSERIYEAARTREVGTSLPPRTPRKWSMKESREASLYLLALLVFAAAGWMIRA